MSSAADQPRTETPIMLFTSWLHKRALARNPKPRTDRPNAFRPRLEALERRDLPSTLAVTSPKDNGTHSLRAAIAAAQSGDTIVFSPKLDGQTITLTTGELDITKNLTIQGPGAAQLAVSSDISRVFEVAANTTVALSGLTISNGNAPVAPGVGTGGGEGGGILNHGTLTVSGCTVSNNYAPGYGGGIYNDGTLTVSGCTVSNNYAQFFGGGIYNDGRLTVTGGIISGNHSSRGGGIYAYGTMTISGCTVSGNSVDDVGGGIWNGGTLTVTGSTISGNSALLGGGFEGGGIYNAGTTAALTVLDSIFSSNSPDNIFGPYTDGGGNTFK
jgi:predicted outer membrane repeat protein